MLLQFGKDPADLFDHFQVEFCRQEEVIVVVAAENGEVRLLPEHFQAAQTGRADQLRIMKG